jgi:hypothetical protein
MADTSSGAAIYDQANKPTVAPINPLDAYEKAGRVNSLMNANKLFQAQQLRGQLAQQAIDENGNYDPNKANALLAGAGPDAALAAPEAIGQNQALRGAQQSQNIQRSQYAAAAIAPLLGLPDDQLHSAMVTTLHRAVDQGIMTGPESTKLALSFSNDPSQLRTQLEQTRMRLLGPEGMQTAIYGRPIVTDDGQVIRGGTQSVQTGAINTPSQPGVQRQTGPETNAAMVETYVENPNQPGTYMRVMQPRSALPGASGVSGASPPPGSPLLRLNGQAGGATPPLAAPPQGQPEQLALDQAAFKKDQLAIPQGQQSVQSLQKAQIALEASNTGRSSQGVHDMLATMQTLGIPTLGLADDVKSYDLAHKYLLDYARKQGGAAHSDFQLQTAEGANASTGINQQAALDVVHTNIGRERQAIAQVMEANQSGVGYGGHASRFSSDTDPRGFAIDAYKPADLDPSDPKSMVGRMTRTERAKFYKSVGIAQRLKLLNPAAPDQGAPAATP